jgi:hypothetical protein
MFFYQICMLRWENGRMFLESGDPYVQFSGYLILLLNKYHICLILILNKFIFFLVINQNTYLEY